jgi:hypothetical protein
LLSRFFFSALAAPASDVHLYYLNVTPALNIFRNFQGVEHRPKEILYPPASSTDQMVMRPEVRVESRRLLQ